MNNSHKNIHLYGILFIQSKKESLPHSGKLFFFRIKYDQPCSMAPVGQVSTQLPQSMQELASMTY